MTATGDFDPQVMARLKTLGGSALVGKLAAVFGEFARDRVRDAAQAGAQGDLDGLARAAHSVRSSAGNVGALRLHAIATELEASARAGQAPAPGRLDDLQAAFVAATTWLADITREAA